MLVLHCVTKDVTPIIKKSKRFTAPMIEINMKLSKEQQTT